jgi:hypothetical protein
MLPGVQEGLELKAQTVFLASYFLLLITIWSYGYYRIGSKCGHTVIIA